MTEARQQHHHQQKQREISSLVRLQHDWEQSIRNVVRPADHRHRNAINAGVRRSDDPLLYFMGGKDKPLDEDEKRRLQDDEAKNRVNFDTFWMQMDESVTMVDGRTKTESHYVDFQVLPTETVHVQASKAEDREIFRVVECNTPGKGGSTLTLETKTRTDNRQSERHSFRSAASTWRHIHSSASRRSVDCIDVSQGGTIGISGSTDGKLRVWEARDGTLRRSLEGHLGDIYVTKLLPSAEVAMSSGADMQIKIWRLSDGLCAATLRGHTSAVKAISFVDRGRNFVSCGRDGTVRLWDCASQSCITSLVSVKDVTMNACCVEENVPFLREKRDQDQAAMDKRDFGTEGKVAIAVSDNGILHAVDVRMRDQIFKVAAAAAEKPLDSCFLTTSGTALVGTRDGSIITYDLRNTHEPLQTWKHCSTPASILSMTGYSTSQICFSTGDGLCALYDYQTNEMGMSFTGSDYDPVYGVATSFSAGSIFTACRDGAIRKYEL